MAPGYEAFSVQISIQEKDTSAIQTIVDEIALFQKLSHPNIVKFYGVEVHHVRGYITRVCWILRVFMQ